MTKDGLQRILEEVAAEEFPDALGDLKRILDTLVERCRPTTDPVRQQVQLDLAVMDLRLQANRLALRHGGEAR